MDFDAAIKSVGSQIAAVAAAPIPFAISLAVLSVLIWRVCCWYYDGRITSLEGRLAFKADEVATLKQSVTALEVDRATKAQPPPQVVELPNHVRKEPSPEQLALRKMATALHSAEEEKAYSRGRFTNKSVPLLNSAILTASKLFGIIEPYPVPVNEGGPLTLGSGIALLHQVLPLLQDGHIEEARRMSQEMYEADAERRRNKG